MTKQETAVILSIFSVNYPNAYARQTTQDKKLLISLMESILGKYEGELVKAAAYQLLAQDSPYPPNVGQLKAQCDRLMETLKMVKIFGVEVIENSELLPVKAYLLKTAEAGREKAQVQAKQQRKKLGPDNFAATVRELDFLVE